MAKFWFGFLVLLVSSVGHAQDPTPYRKDLDDQIRALNAFQAFTCRNASWRTNFVIQFGKTNFSSGYMTPPNLTLYSPNLMTTGHRPRQHVGLTLEHGQANRDGTPSNSSCNFYPTNGIPYAEPRIYNEFNDAYMEAANLVCTCTEWEVYPLGTVIQDLWDRVNALDKQRDGLHKAVSSDPAFAELVARELHKIQSSAKK